MITYWVICAALGLFFGVQFVRQKFEHRRRARSFDAWTEAEMANRGPLAPGPHVEAAKIAERAVINAKIQIEPLKEKP